MLLVAAAGLRESCAAERGLNRQGSGCSEFAAPACHAHRVRQFSFLFKRLKPRGVESSTMLRGGGERCF